MEVKTTRALPRFVDLHAWAVLFHPGFQFFARFERRQIRRATMFRRTFETRFFFKERHCLKSICESQERCCRSQWHNSVAEKSQRISPRGKPMSQPTKFGFR